MAYGLGLLVFRIIIVLFSVISIAIVVAIAGLVIVIIGRRVVGSRGFGIAQVDHCFVLLCYTVRIGATVGVVFDGWQNNAMR